jgi:hypothetical protein
VKIIIFGSARQPFTWDATANTGDGLDVAGRVSECAMQTYLGAIPLTNTLGMKVRAEDASESAIT